MGRLVVIAVALGIVAGTVVVFAVAGRNDATAPDPIVANEKDSAADNPETEPEHAPCEPPDTKTIRENADVRIFEFEKDTDDSLAGDTIICHRETGDENTFFVREFGGYPERLILAGDFLIAEVDSGCAADCYSPPIEYSLVNARTGDVWLLEESESGTDQSFTIGSAALDESGAIVYAVERSQGAKDSEFFEPLPALRPPGKQVVRFVARRNQRQVVDSGDGLDISSLRADRGVVSWNNNGTRRSAAVVN